MVCIPNRRQVLAEEIWKKEQKYGADKKGQMVDRRGIFGLKKFIKTNQGI